MMMKEIKSPFWRTIYEYGLITVSIWIMVVGIYFFKFPNHFAFGGITGFSTVVSQLTHWSASDFTSVTNTALLLLGFLFLGKGFGLKTVYATMVMSVSLSLLERFCPLSAPLTSQPLLELMFAIFLPAVGTAILFNIHCHDLKEIFQHEHRYRADVSRHCIRCCFLLYLRSRDRPVLHHRSCSKITGDR